MNKVIRIIIKFLVAIMMGCTILFGCNSIPGKVKEVLNKAGDNKKELQKVIDHYKKTGENLKLKAAYFLIANMEDKYTVSGGKLQDYYNLLKEVDALKVNGIKRDFLDRVMKIKMDSLKRERGNLNYDSLKMESDMQAIGSDFLVKNIDYAFMVWNKPWAKHVSFDDFCEFILPYRIHTEPLSNWREYFYNELISFQDSVKDKSDPKELIMKISNYLYRKWNHFENFSSKGFYPDLIEMAKCNGGLCNHRYYLFTGMCRSIGLPVSIESTPQWTTYTGGHSWNVFVDTDGKKRPFNGAEDNMCFYKKNVIPMGDGSSICTKVYRETFALQKESLPFVIKADQFIPELFRNKNLIDVTDNYDFYKTKCCVKLDGNLNGKIVYLYTFNFGDEINVVAWARVKNNSANFNYIGLPAFYLVATFADNQLQFVHKPLELHTEKELRNDYNPDLKKTGTVKLYRKFYFSWAFSSFEKGMVGAIFQGSNNSDFSDAVDLYTIKKQAWGYGEVVINFPKKFRYLRYLSADSAPVRVSEIEFSGVENDVQEKRLEGKVIGKAINVDNENEAIYENAFDDNIRTNFNAKAGSWVGIDLGETHKARVTRIGFLARNNFNEIEKKHVYELFYRANDWKSLGKQVAEKHYLIYKNVPRDALLLLKDLTEGRQERIFMYDFKKNEQVWW